MNPTPGSTEAFQLVKTFDAVHSNTVNRLQLSQDGRYFASTSDDGSVAVYDLKPTTIWSSVDPSPILIRQYEPVMGIPMALCWLPDGKSVSLLVGFEDGKIRLYKRPLQTLVSLHFTRMIPVLTTVRRPSSAWSQPAFHHWSSL